MHEDLLVKPIDLDHGHLSNRHRIALERKATQIFNDSDHYTVCAIQKFTPEGEQKHFLKGKPFIINHLFPLLV